MSTINSRSSRLTRESIDVLTLAFDNNNNQHSDDNYDHSLYEIVPLVASVLIKMVAGSGYVISTYNSQLQSILGMSTVQISWFGTAMTIGNQAEVIPFYFMTFYGPKVVLLIGAFGLATGYLVVSLTASSVISYNVVTVIFMGFVIGFSTSWMSAASLITCTTSCLPQHRGAVSGILSASFAFTGAFYTMMYEAYSLSVPAFLMYMALFGTGVSLIAYPSNHMISDDGYYTDPVSIIPMSVLLTIGCLIVICASILDITALYISMTVLLYALVLGLVVLTFMMLSRYGFSALSLSSTLRKRDEDCFELDDRLRTMGGTTTLFSKAKSKTRSPFLPPLPSDDEHTTTGERSSLLHSSNNDNIIDDIVEDKDKEEEDNNISNIGGTLLSVNDQEGVVDDDVIENENNKSLTWSEAVKTPKFWLIYCLEGTMFGVSTSIYYNIDYIVDAHSASDSDDDVKATLKANSESLFSVFNAASRIVVGLGSDYLLVQYGVSRYSLFTAAGVLLTLNCILLVFVTTNPSFFNFCMVFTGFCNGCTSVLVDSITLDTFGPKHFGVIIGTVYTSSLVGILFFYNLISTVLYDDYASSNGSCMGRPQCFTTTFWIYAGFGVISVIAAYVSSDDSSSKLKPRD